MDSSVSSCLGHYGLECHSLPMDHACACVSPCLVTGLGCETLFRTLGSGVSLCLGQRSLAYEPVDPSVSPCLGHLLRTPAEAVVNNIYH